MSEVFVVQHSHPHEGHSGAVAVCATLEDARTLKKILSVAGGELWSIFRAPMWPDGVPQTEWYNIEPVEDSE